jgi:acetoin utilization deacetylase AcuC-like enzyme
MEVFYSTKHGAHAPTHEFTQGELLPYLENSARIEDVYRKLIQHKYPITLVKDSLPEKLLKEIHSPDYLKFVQEVCLDIEKDQTLYIETFPNYIVARKIVKNTKVLLGMYSHDIYAPLTRGTYEAAIGSASAAYAAALCVMGTNQNAYALCRPPGHHARKSTMGGYCYINNAAVAAQYLSKLGKVAILDVDYHHGNGTQEAFYDRSDVLFVSIHAATEHVYPYYSGYVCEKGEGAGKGTNINIPLKDVTGVPEYRQALNTALRKIKDFNSSYLVVSFGGDTYEKDPLGTFKLPLSYYSEMSKRIFGLHLPTAVIQEGGYNVDDLGAIVVNFLSFSS